jgi:hypothetical protein
MRKSTANQHYDGHCVSPRLLLVLQNESYRENISACRDHSNLLLATKTQFYLENEGQSPLSLIHRCVLGESIWSSQSGNYEVTKFVKRKFVIRIAISHRRNVIIMFLNGKKGVTSFIAWNETCKKRKLIVCLLWNNNWRSQHATKGAINSSKKTNDFLTFVLYFPGLVDWRAFYGDWKEDFFVRKGFRKSELTFGWKNKQRLCASL